MEWLVFGVMLNVCVLAFSIGYNLGANQQGELKKFNDFKFRRLNQIFID